MASHAFAIRDLDSAFDADGCPALIRAIRLNRRRCALLFINMKISVNIVFAGRSALNFAVTNNQYTVAHAILCVDTVCLSEISNLISFSRRSNNRHMLDLLELVQQNYIEQ